MNIQINHTEISYTNFANIAPMVASALMTFDRLSINGLVRTEDDGSYSEGSIGGIVIYSSHFTLKVKCEEYDREMVLGNARILADELTMLFGQYANQNSFESGFKPTGNYLSQKVDGCELQYHSKVKLFRVESDTLIINLRNVEFQDAFKLFEFIKISPYIACSQVPVSSITVINGGRLPATSAYAGQIIKAICNKSLEMMYVSGDESVTTINFQDKTIKLNGKVMPFNRLNDDTKVTRRAKSIVGVFSHA